MSRRVGRQAPYPHPYPLPKKEREDLDLARLSAQIIHCRRCPRLVAWRERVAREKVRRFASEPYWGKPLPGFGDPQARLLIVGLAPAAHGGNRTGRMFTGDRSGDWLYGALDRHGFANQPSSSHRDDGLVLTNGYITAAVRCAPPANKPTAQEFANCRPFLLEELVLLSHLRVILALGGLAWRVTREALEALGRVSGPRQPAFGHGAEWAVSRTLTVLASYHPSQQNTFTNRLTRPMFDRVFRRVQELLTSVGG